MENLLKKRILVVKKIFLKSVFFLVKQIIVLIDI